MTITINGTTGITNDGGYTGDGVVFADTTPANTLVTTTGGNVGIGTSSPGQKFEVAGSALFKTGTSDFIYLLSDSGAMEIVRAAGDAYIDLKNSTGEDYDCRIQSVGTGGTLAFSTAGPERARIDSSGNLLVGTTSQPSGSVYGSGFIASSESRRVLMISGSATVESNRVEFYNPNGQVGRIATNGSSTAYVTSSDYRLKENIASMTGALAKVAALKPVTYIWKADGSDGEGFIAHELAEVFPDAVVGKKDAVDAEGNPVYQGIDTSFLVATLTAAIQEQQQLITALTARVAALDARLTSLEGK